MPKKTNTPPHGVSRDEFSDDQITPPPIDIEELARRLWPLRRAGDMLIELQTKVERLEKDADGTTEKMEFDSIDKHLRNLAADIVDLKGTSGNNGKLGTLRTEVTELKGKIEKQEARRWTLIVTAIGMILTAGSLAIAGGRWVGKLENRVEQLEKYHPVGDR